MTPPPETERKSSTISAYKFYREIYDLAHDKTFSRAMALMLATASRAVGEVMSLRPCLPSRAPPATRNSSRARARMTAR
jgi:hypothetical protein